MARSKKEQVIAWRYYVGMHLGICEGPVDALLQLRSADRVAWSGNVTESGQITVDAPNLFGGDEREGGLQGTVDVMMGEEDQAANAYLTAQQTGPQPGYRGLLGLVFRAFYWGTSQYLKPVAVLAKRIAEGWNTDGGCWYPEKAAIALGATAQSSRFVEDFSSFTLPAGATRAPVAGGSYTITDPQFFSVVSTPYGSGLKLTNIEDTTVDGEAYRAIPDARYTSIRFKGCVDVNASGDDSTDADIMIVAFGQGSTPGLVVILSRDATGTGSSQRPAINDVPVGAAALTVGTWYQFDFGLDWDTGDIAYTITNLSTQAVFASGTSTIGGSITSIDRLLFAGDIGSGERLNDAGTVADVELIVGTPLIGMNPAHIVYQCLTDPQWGSGAGVGLVDDTNFRAAADTFHAEGLGLCLHWTQQEPVERLIQLVIDHAGANLVQNPRTGLFQLVLLRGGYDPEDLPTFDPAHVLTVERMERPALDEAVNEVAVTFTDIAAGPGKSGTVKAQNLANITAQGGVVSRTKSYPGIPTASLAGRVAMRDLRALSSPLAKLRITTDRTAYGLVEGSLFRLNWPKLGVTGLVLRVLRVNYGQLGAGKITIEAGEDVYGLPAASYAAQQPSGWVPPTTEPSVAPVRVVREANYYEAQLVLGATDAQALEASAAYLIAAAVRPNSGALDFGMRTRVGSEAFAEADRSAFAPSGRLTAALGHAATTATLEGITDGGQVLTGRYAQVGAELVRVDAWDAGTGAITIGRGALGTVAAAHADGALVVFLDQFFAVDPTERLVGEEVDVKLIPRTGGGDLAEASAPTDSITLDALIQRPYAPGRLRIDGEAYPATVEEGPVTISWAHRHRTQQNLEGDESGNIGPEPGVTYAIEVSDADTDEVLAAANGIEGTEYTVADGLIASGMNVRVQLWAVRADANALALRSAFEVTRELASIGDPKITWRFLLTSGEYVDIVSIVTGSGAYFEARRYSAAGVLLATLNCRLVDSAAYDSSAEVIALGVHDAVDPSELWIIDVAAPGLTKISLEPDFPTPSGAERVYVAAAGGSVYAVNFDGSRCNRYDPDGTQVDTVDDTLSRRFDCDGTHLIFAISGGFERRNPTTLDSIGDVTFSPAATRVGTLRLLGGEVVFLGDPSSGGNSTLYRYNATTGARIATYANVPFGASGSGADLARFGDYLSTGDTAAPKVFDTANGWAVVPSAGAAAALESAQRHNYTFGATVAGGGGGGLPAIADDNSTFNDEGTATTGWTASNGTLSVASSYLRLTKTTGGTSSSMTKSVTFPTTNKDFLIYVKMRASRGTDHFGALGFVNGSDYLLLWTGSANAGGSYADQRVSIVHNVGGANIDADPTSYDYEGTALEICLQYDCKFSTLNLFVKTSGKWLLRARVAGSYLANSSFSFYLGTPAPSGAWIEFDYLTICRPNVVAIGDSLCEGKTLHSPDRTLSLFSPTNNWQHYATIYGSLRNNLIVNKGVGSQTSAQIEARMAADVTSHGPRVVLMHASGNDFINSVSQATRTSNIQDSIDTIVGAGAECVLLNTVYGASDYAYNPGHRDYALEWWEDYRPTLTDVALAIDIMQPLLSGGFQSATFAETADHIHPNAAGYQEIGEAIAAA